MCSSSSALSSKHTNTHIGVVTITFFLVVIRVTFFAVGRRRFRTVAATFLAGTVIICIGAAAISSLAKKIVSQFISSK
jgi:hypothetical protein